MLISHKSQEGFSLIEVIVFVSLVSIILIAAAGFTVQMLNRMSYNQHKLYAAHYVNDVQEWLDGEREADWPTFVSAASTGGTLYCINDPIGISDDIDTLTPTTLASCGATGITGETPPLYRRTLVLTSDNAGSTVTARIEVMWFENGRTTTEQTETVYSVWQ